MHRHATCYPDADGCDLAIGLAGNVARHPDSAATLNPACSHPEVPADADERVLEDAYVADYIDWLIQGDNRVADQLTGAMPRDLAAAVHVYDRRSWIAKGAVERAGALARRIYRPVLEQQAGVGYLATHSLLVEPSLQVPGLKVISCLTAEPDPGENELTVHVLRLCRSAPRGCPPLALTPLLKMYRVYYYAEQETWAKEEAR